MSVRIPYRGRTVNLQRLTPRDYIDLGNEFHDQYRERLVRDLNDANAPPEQRLSMLRDHERRRGLASVVIEYLFSAEGARTALARAIERSGETDPETGDPLTVDDFDLDPRDLVRYALRLINVDLEKEAAAADKDKGDGGPLPETGGEAAAA